MRMTRDDDNTTTILEMDNSTTQQLSHQNGGGVGGGQLGGGVNNSSNITGSGVGGGGLNNKQGDDNHANAGNGHQYTMPGVLHYIQHEFSRLEMERSQWDIDRAELQVNEKSLTAAFFTVYIFHSRKSIEKTTSTKRLLLASLCILLCFVCV